MNRAKPRDQARAFVDWMLLHASQIEFAAARYGGEGKVAEVIPCRMAVKSSEDFERVYGWLARQNAAGGGCNIWTRPHSLHAAHPLLMLDDVPPGMGARISKKYQSALVETRPGNCQVWILARPLPREQRQDVLRALAPLAGADRGAVSEPRWGRCPGFMGRKPGDAGVWVNLISFKDDGQRLDPSPYLPDGDGQGAGAAPVFSPPEGGGVLSNRPSNRNPGDRDRSAQHFGYAVAALRAGVGPEIVVARIAARALQDRKRRDPVSAAEYAARTVRAAARARAAG